MPAIELCMGWQENDVCKALDTLVVALSADFVRGIVCVVVDFSLATCADIGIYVAARRGCYFQ
jgi:hypothetical protein